MGHQITGAIRHKIFLYTALDVIKAFLDALLLFWKIIYSRHSGFKLITCRRTKCSIFFFFKWESDEILRNENVRKGRCSLFANEN